MYKTLAIRAMRFALVYDGLNEDEKRLPTYEALCEAWLWVLRKVPRNLKDHVRRNAQAAFCDYYHDFVVGKW